MDVGTEADARALFRAAVEAGLVRDAAAESTCPEDAAAAANVDVDNVRRHDVGWAAGDRLRLMLVFNSHLLVCGEGIVARFLLASQPHQALRDWPARFAPWEEPNPFAQ
jgi:hypothetical protein